MVNRNPDHCIDANLDSQEVMAEHIARMRASEVMPEAGAYDVADLSDADREKLAIVASLLTAGHVAKRCRSVVSVGQQAVESSCNDGDCPLQSGQLAALYSDTSIATPNM